MNRKSYHLIVTVIGILLLFVQASDGCAITTVPAEKLTPSLVADVSLSSAAVGVAHVPGDFGVASSPSAVSLGLADEVYPSVGLLFPRTNKYEYSKSVELSKRADSHMQLTIPTIVAIVVFLALFIIISIGLQYARGIDLFHHMRRYVYHSPTFAVTRPTTTNIIRGFVSRTSLRTLSLGNTLRNPSPGPDISPASTIRTVPADEVNHPAPVHISTGRLSAH